jgi:surfactin synthase thioesterase subunit
MMVFGGDSDPDANLEELEGWRRQTSSSFELTVLPGGHFYFFREHQTLMEAACRQL